MIRDHFDRTICFKPFLTEAEVEDLRGKFDRSLLRKQKEKALRLLDEEKSKVAKLEQILANKENQVGQLESVLAQSKLKFFQYVPSSMNNDIIIVHYFLYYCLIFMAIIH